MRFRNRLALFLVLTIAIVQVLTAIAVYAFARNALVDQGERELNSAATVFVNQLDAIGQEVGESVRVLSLDYALRVAIAQRDRETVLSALRNHGRRVGASRMLLIDLDGTVIADTDDAASLEQKPVPFPDLLELAENGGGSTGVVAIDNQAVWMVVVPVLAPVPIAFIAAGIPMDDALMQQLQQQSPFGQSIELAVHGDKGWSVVARAHNPVALAGTILGNNTAPGDGSPKLLRTGGREILAMGKSLATATQSAPVVAVLGYPLDEELRAYEPLEIALVTLMVAGLAIAGGGAIMIARGVSRPVEALAMVARRIGAGDYGPPPMLNRRDEIGELASAFGSMAKAIGEREERIQFQAGHDAATGLVNRHVIEEEMRRHIAADSGPAALLMVGVGRLPEIVKTVGHEIADRLMRAAATRLLNAGDSHFIARSGDTSFAVWLPGADAGSAITAGSLAAARLARPYKEDNFAVDLDAAVGIALYPAHAAEPSVLLRQAEVALFAASRLESPVVIYSPAADPHRPERLSLMSELRQALETDELRLAFQPKLHLPSMKIGGVEALVRWQNPQRGFIPPDDFIPLAEETGNIRLVTDWALAAGCNQAAAWDRRGYAMTTAINLSVRDLADPTLPRRVQDLLTARGLSAERVVLEITESAIMGEPDAAIAVLKDLANRGIDLAIDDFGVGQSSFAYLRRLPVRELKIDKAFVLKVAESKEDQTIVRSIIELGHRLGYRITAEGVENAEALQFLAGAGCDYAQGYYIAKALMPDAFDVFLAEARWPAREKAIL